MGPLIDKEGNYEFDPVGMAELLAKQYTSVFSVQREALPDQTIFFGTDPNNRDLSDVNFTESDIPDAINKMSYNSSPGADGFPAILLKKCKCAFTKPLNILYRKSLDQSVLPDSFKQSLVIPIHKGGS